MKIILTIIVALCFAACGGSHDSVKGLGMKPWEWGFYMDKLPPHYITWLPGQKRAKGHVFLFTAVEGYQVTHGKIIDTMDFINHEVRPYAQAYMKATMTETDSLYLPVWFDIMGTSSDGIPHLQVYFPDKTGEHWFYQVKSPYVSTGLLPDSAAGILDF